MGKTSTWYHGTPFEFETFDAAHLGKGNDQLGSGFYFTDREDTAFGYAHGEGGDASCVLVVSLALERPMPEAARFSRAQIEAMMRASPNFMDMMSNWGEIGFEKEHVVVGRAVDAYEEMNEGGDDALMVLNALSNDFWQGEEASFLRAVREAAGFDGVIRKSGNETHAVAWFPEQVTIVERKAVQAPKVNLA